MREAGGEQRGVRAGSETKNEEARETELGRHQKGRGQGV